MENTLLFNVDTDFCIILPYLKDKEKGSVAIDKIFALQISNNQNQAVNYFMGDFSRPMLNQFAIKLLGIPEKLEHCEPADVILAEFYELMSNPFDGKEFKWEKVTKYRGENENGRETRFSTYIYTVTRNHFLGVANKEKLKHFSEIEIEDIKKEDYDLILCSDVHSKDEFMEKLNTHNLVYNAYFNLPENDRIILQSLVIEKVHWSEAFEELRYFLNPSGPNNEWVTFSFEEKQALIDKCWNNKQKQDAMKGLKKRALSHLAYEMIEMKKEGKIW